MEVDGKKTEVSDGSSEEETDTVDFRELENMTSGACEISTEENPKIEIEQCCQPCEFENVAKKASGLCSDCGEYMCNRCFRHHLKGRMYRNHKLIDMNEARILSEQREEQIEESEIQAKEDVEKCAKHDYETVKFYCRKHNIVGCGDCIILGHNACKPEYIRDVAKDFKESDKLKSLMRQVEQLENTNQDIGNKIESNRLKTSSMEETAINVVQEFRAEVNAYLDKTEAELMTEIEKFRVENDSRLDKLQRDGKRAAAKVKILHDTLRDHYGHDKALFIHVVNSGTTVEEIQREIATIQRENKIKQFTLAPDDQVHKLVTTARTFCQWTLPEDEMKGFAQPTREEDAEEQTDHTAQKELPKNQSKPTPFENQRDISSETLIDQQRLEDTGLDKMFVPLQQQHKSSDKHPMQTWERCISSEKQPSQPLQQYKAVQPLKQEVLTHARQEMKREEDMTKLSDIGANSTKLEVPATPIPYAQKRNPRMADEKQAEELERKEKMNSAVIYIQRIYRAKLELRRLRQEKINKGPNCKIASLLEDIKVDDNMCGICGVFFLSKLEERIELESFNESHMRYFYKRVQESPQLRKLQLVHIRLQHIKEADHIQKASEMNNFRKKYNQYIAPNLTKINTFLFNTDYGLLNQAVVAKNYPREQIVIERMKRRSKQIEMELQLLLNSRMWSTTTGFIEQNMNELNMDFKVVKRYVEETYSKIHR